MIYYITLDNALASGGVKTQYRHVEILNEAGAPAAMLHQKRPFTSATWFQSNAPICYNAETEIAPGDTLVWPEILRSSIQPYPGVTQYIFNQNIHYSWRGVNPLSRYEQHIDGTMVLTEYERDFFTALVPGHRVGVVRHGIDSRIFFYDGRPKKQQIAFMPRKHGDEAEAVFGWLYQTRVLDKYNVVAIDQKTETESAEIMRDSMWFLAFGYPEGGTLPPFEALACGAKVIGYGGFASDDLLTQAGGRVVSSGDTCKFAKIADLLLVSPFWEQGCTDAMSKQVLNMFSMDGEKKALLRFFNEGGSRSSK